MKTTVEIDDRLLASAKDEARRRKTTLRRLIEEGLRHELGRKPRARTYRMRDASVGRPNGLRPGVDLADWDRMLGIVYEGHGA